MAKGIYMKNRGFKSKNEYDQDDPEDDIPDSVQGEIDTIINSTQTKP